MPHLLTERESLDRQRQDLFTRLAAYQAQLDLQPADNREHRERLDWQIRRALNRIAYVEGRLASLTS